MPDLRVIVSKLHVLSANKLLLRSVGAVLLTAGLFYIAQRFMALDPGTRIAALSGGQIVVLGGATLAYGALVALLAMAWDRMAGPGIHRPLRDTIIPYGRSVIAKYIPGSVLQYASRQLLGAQAGFSHKAMARASLVEIMLHLTMALGIGGGAMLLTGTHVWMAVPALAAGGALFTGLWLKRSEGFEAAAVLQGIFFTGFAALTLLCALMLTQDFQLSLNLTGIFMLAWVAGFVVPLAPGGIGIREAVLIALAGNIASPALILGFAAITRLMTLGGDLLLGLGCYLLPDRPARRNMQASLPQ